MRNHWGRFTAKGDASVEATITDLVGEVAEVVRNAVPAPRYRALLLIGGYGRGEGGVEVRNGISRPHNNLDFLLLTVGLDAAARNRLKERLDELLLPLARRYDIGIEMGVIPAWKLRYSPCLVMWYDVRFGHKTVLGDAQFVPSLSHFRVDRILPSDVRWLLVNRGTQIVINDFLIARGPVSSEERRFIIKLAMKAIIGYGDALLFFLGDYHWSYEEKARRMRARRDVDERFQRVYDEAVAFRFQPRYEDYAARDLAAWMDDLRGQFVPIHVECESRRLRRTGWEWKAYPELALRQAVFDEALSPRAALKKARNVLRGPRYPGHAGPLVRLGYRCCGQRGLLPLCFPVPAYNVPDPAYRELAKAALDAQSADTPELRRAYLYYWGRQVDPNFFKVVRQFSLALAPGGTVP